MLIAELDGQTTTVSRGRPVLNSPACMLRGLELPGINFHFGYVLAEHAPPVGVSLKRFLRLPSRMI
ncbi:hypothetical protein ACVIHH_008218 [Bradyrhizobium sp. USDA 4518]